MGAFGSVFNTYAGLYLPKDNDLLLSMPIPISALVGARLFGVYLMGLLYSAVVILPAVIVYWVTAGVTLPAVLGGLLITLLISVFVLTISCVLGWIVAKISRKLKHKSLITVLISLVVIGAYYFVYFKAQGMIQDLLANATVYGARIKGAAYPVYLFGSVGIGDARASAIVSAAVAVLFSLMWVLLSRSFLRIATSTGKVARREYRETHSRHRSANIALLCREFSRFTANPNYMLNCGLGTFLIPNPNKLMRLADRVGLFYTLKALIWQCFLRLSRQSEYETLKFKSLQIEAENVKARRFEHGCLIWRFC